MNWNLLVTKPAQKNLEKLPLKDRASILAALAAMEADPFAGDIKRLQASGGWRRRVRNYRILYDLNLNERLIVVTSILRRSSTTY
jgi:mRNA interferase RelE/StbE